jgi:hypothetical protein
VQAHVGGAAQGLVDRGGRDRSPLGLGGVEEAGPGLAAVPGGPRPNPPIAAIACAASPARNTRPSANRSASSARGCQPSTLRTSTGRSGAPTAARTNATHRSGGKSAGSVPSTWNTQSWSPSTMTSSPGASGVVMVHVANDAPRR